ncbi:hypothetical protein LENED_010103 [Lentinula edodes]|uniref:Uncharacterized protein n=1 Tax=Lentinula edodes TaxID=5353 RepID=A0A1Q3ELI8_LENED|nr:hypothetical protein LENED_010103 [Lentinula edodes]
MNFEVRPIIGRKRQDLDPDVADDGSEVVQEKEYSPAKRLKEIPSVFILNLNLILLLTLEKITVTQNRPRSYLEEPTYYQEEFFEIPDRFGN